MTKSQQITVRITAQERKKLQEIADRESRTLAGQIRHLINQALQEKKQWNCSTGWVYSSGSSGQFMNLGTKE